MIESVDSPSGSLSRMSFVTTPIQRILVSNWFSLRHPTSMAFMSVAPAPLDLAQEHVSTLVLPASTSTRETTITFSTSGGATFSVSAGVGPNSTLDVTSIAAAEDRQLIRCRGPGIRPQFPAMPTTGWFRCWPPIDPRNVALPKENRPPSDATNW